MRRQLKLIFATLSLCLQAASSDGQAADPKVSDGIEFFETRIRPLLVEQCYQCHNSATSAEGSLAVDHRAALLKGGDGGAIVVPNKPAESRLLAILKHEVPGMKMPQGGAKLADRVIADFEKWIAMGAPDPRDKPPTVEELAKVTSWEAILEKRKKWWSFQPIQKLDPPAVPGNRWSEHPVDRFVLAKLREQGLEPSEPAEARTLVRRLFFALIGLPPTADEVEHWTARLAQPRGYEELVEHLLDSPHFGERWARHWMDWIRYADSHGSEGDPAIENGWLYRDYLIRALNADVSFDQLVREHIAGDLLEQPRINESLGINESLIGLAHWRMVFHGFSPTDALDEKVRFIDDQINAFSKAFLGLTISCTRCHDHKFDAISQKDYYALFGVLGSCRPGRVAIDVPEKLNANRDQLAALKPRIRVAVANDWLEHAAKLRERLLAADGPWKQAEQPKFALHPWWLLRKEVSDGASFAEAWSHRVAAWQSERRQRAEHAQRKTLQRWQLNSESDYATWFRTGGGLSETPSHAGEFAVAASGDAALVGIYPSGVISHGLSAKHPARLTSGNVRLDGDCELWLRVIGDGGASARYVVHDYPRNGTIFPVAALRNEWHWQKFDLTYWNGDEIHLELTAGRDAPLLVNNEPRSWFGVREALIVQKGEAGPSEPHEFLDPWFETAASKPPKSFDELADQFVAAVTAAIQVWQAGKATDAQASLLDACLKQGLLPNDLEMLATAKPLIADYRRLEEEIVVPTRVPGLEETVARNQPLFERGNHKRPGEVVPRRFLEAIDATPYQTTHSGRRQLAEDVMRASNPLTRRVIVNRLWHHLFGRGIVATPDNFGRLGHAPTHPELLDFLATRFLEQRGSLKESIRFLVTSKTWQLTSRPSAKALQADPDNQWLSHTHVRRLEAEAIRDSLLAVSGSLNRDLFGTPVDGNSPRRSVYLRVPRNSLDPFLRAFDFPEPFTAVGRRDVTNVPAQSLTLMNDERVASLAANWASRVLAEKSASEETRIQGMFLAAFSRPAQAAEVAKFQTYLAETKAAHAELAKQVAELRRQINERQASVRKLVDPVRERLLADAKAKSAAGDQVAPKPIGRWEFEENLHDAVGTAHGESRGGAHLDAGALIVSQQAHVVTAPLRQTLKEKTLEAWVQLDNLDQRGGGVMTIQSRDGALFDSIVFAEQAQRQWLAGSNFFQRTQPFNGPADSDAASRPIHVAIAYHADGRIVGYRDGQPYGKAYQSSGPLEFKAGESVVSFGVRHLPAGGNRMLSGRILRAQLYDRALTADEIRATSQSVPYFVTESQILAALADADRQQLDADKQRIADLEDRVMALGPTTEPLDDKALWTDLARAMFTFKEFLFVK